MRLIEVAGADGLRNTGFSDDDGFYRIAAAPGTVIVTASKPGFETKMSEFVLDGGHGLELQSHRRIDSPADLYLHWRRPVNPVKEIDRAAADALSIQQRFAAALDALVEQVKDDRSILAAILCGSLSHDTVWAKSDIDLVLVTIDDKKVEHADVALYADGVNVHALLMPRAEFRKTVEGSVTQLVHALASGQGPAALHARSRRSPISCARLADDRRARHAAAAAARGDRALPPIDKAHKWFVTRGDLDYTALWILYAATPLAQIEVIGARLLADREVIPQALKLNPAFFKIIYTDLLNAKKTRKSVQAALDAVDALPGRARADAVRAGDRSSARGRRGALGDARSKSTSRATSTSAA